MYFAVNCSNQILLPFSDVDTVADSADNCPTIANADQGDRDRDGVGDLCDNCVEAPNALSCMFLALSCIGRPARLFNQKLVPDRPVQFERTESTVLEGRACGFNLFGFVPMNTLDRTARAYRQMTVGYETFYVTDVEMQEVMSRWVIGTSLCTKLSATAYRRR